ncbi:ABC transporter permease [Cochlodiniinecator piscidefendens]|uniref:ABC transporter permease n=1 Tax=Cochlodiniinecator piscidefendens TaxID=2715756 RepID=UPI00140E6A1E|nr:ABC transporter permease subunit [Cochlodiniinecator piscidefendens]
MLGPVLAGLAGTLAPAFGYLPAVGATEFSLAPFQDLFDWRGFWPAVWLSVFVGIVSAVLSLSVVVMIVASLQGSAFFTFVHKMLSPLLAVPHAAAAFGIAFLIAPSGWASRLVSPWLTGWNRPPDLLIVQDPWGLSLIAGLVAKEIPFLLLMMIAAMGQVDFNRSITVARSLGYRREVAWLKVIFPRVYKQIRLPVYVVLAFSLSVVDVAMILGPNTPPTLSVQIVKWMGDPELTLRLRAAAAALVQFVLVLGVIGLWRIGEVMVAKAGLAWVQSGHRGRGFSIFRPFAFGFAVLSALAIFAGIAGLITWSFAGFWSFPEFWPDMFTLRNWMRHGTALADPIRETVLLASVATIVALILTIGCLEAEHRHGLRVSTRGVWLLYLPLLIPQTAFLPGLQTLMLNFGIHSGRVPVIAAHIVFVLPYVFLSLSDPFRAWDRRYGTVASALGASQDRVLWTVRMPMLLAPVLTAAAVGFSVSVGQYLPTLLIGGGRVQSLTTEAVALASGGDRRAIGVYGLAQTVAALVPFAIALLLPRLIWSNRKALRNED